MFTHAQRRQTAQRWLLASFVVGAAAVIIPGLMFSPVAREAKSLPSVTGAMHTDLPTTRAAIQADCSDFDNQWEAQAYLQTQPAAAVQRLDEDRDGVACERLP
jgi:hypothetical protein